MTYTKSKILSDKVRYIYENNNNSALFVRAANDQLETNNVKGAIEILNKGLKNYPDHPVAYLLLGKAYITLGNYNLAEEFIRKGSSLIQCRETYEYYLGEVSKTRDQRSMFNISRDKLVPKPPAAEDPTRHRDAAPNSEQKSNSENLTSRIDDRFELINDAISKAKSIERSDSLSDENIPDASLLVTETLAKIYRDQGEFDEAISVYEKLIKQDPDKSGHYSKMIEEIRKSLNS